ncbi:large conductance mechanosensitive channel [Luteococcus japonicus]|uniref:Large-conductance mechanosensitive channel n=2 Tax=Luteococcus japonicus TaxID=33984 RepID=A0A1R4JFQ5_9ACTN|nr:MscL family protein [Luteococcus japonicus]ROR54215.1 large conductance mechanosensitive channel [Luteococcus japonicus]SJN30764.1 Large-conductance mechanosensitive channel [Luteococcus japonicus LSP_Lj1]
MKGFKDFVLRGNLIEMAVAFIIGGAFATVVTAFTKVVMEMLAKAGGAPNFDDWKIFGLTTVGPFLTALIAFLILAFIVYFFIVKPYEAAKNRFMKPAEDGDTPESLLAEIRDLMAAEKRA